jgi:UDP-glucose 4-epimerase
MKILITGGAGFIGSHLAQRFVEDEHEVVVLDNLSSGKQTNLTSSKDQIHFVQGDIRDLALLNTLSVGCELVYHQAAVVSVPYSVEHPQETHDVNIQGTLNVLQAARECRVRRVVFASSAAIYGETPKPPQRESMVAAPCSPYGVEKITGEHYLSCWNRLYGVETVSLRYFNVFGPRQDPSSPYSGVISIFVDKILSGETPVVFGDGEQYRDFVYVENVVAANVLAGTVSGANGRCYNVGCGIKTTLNDLVQLLAGLAEKKVNARYANERAGDIRESIADISRIEHELGYRPLVGVREGLRRLLQHVRGERGL